MKSVWKYSAGNYVADSVYFLPIALLPIFITNLLGADQVAYYYIVTMIIGLLYVIPASTMRSLFAEGSYDEASIPNNIKEAIKTTSIFMIPAMIVLIVGGKHILMLFGAQYVTSGIVFLNIMVLLGIFAGGFMLCGSLFRLTNNISGLIIRNSVFTGSLILSVYYFIDLGLIGVGIAHAIAYMCSVFVCLFIHKKTISISS